MKIIFLDFDGVLNTLDYQLELQNANKSCEDNFGSLFSPVAMDNLYRIVRATGAKIVVISSWKEIYGLEGLRQMWQERGYKGEIDDVTRNVVSDEWLLNADLSMLDNFNFPHPKSLDISDYLKTHNVSNFVIIDDEPVASDEQKSHLFQTSFQKGLTKAMADNVIAYLLSL